MKRIRKILAALGLTAVLAAGASVAAPTAQARPVMQEKFWFKYGILPGAAGLNCEFGFTVNTALYVTMVDVSLHGCNDPGWYQACCGTVAGQWFRKGIPTVSWSMFDLWTGQAVSHRLYPPRGLTSAMRSTIDGCHYGHPMAFDIYFFPGYGYSGGTILHRSLRYVCSESGGTVPLN